MTKKINGLLICFLLLTFVVEAQQDCKFIFEGRVTDETGAPLIGTTILLTPGSKGTVTDDKGRFRITNLCNTSYTVDIQFVGFKSRTETILITKNLEKQYTLEEDTQVLQEVVVSETHQQTDHSQNFDVLDEAKLATTAGKSLGEAVKEIPGVSTIQAGPGIFKPVIHGVHSQRILILNYGIRQEGQQWGAEHAPEIDPFIASNIIVIKDASSIKYGTDALGGVIVINPPELPVTNTLGGTIQTVMQSNGRSGTLSGMLEGGIKDHDGWGWRIQGTAKRSGDFHTPDYSLTNTGVEELNFSAATGYHAKKFGVEMFFSHFQSQLGILKGTSISNLDDLVSAMEREPPQFTSDFSYDIGAPRQEVSHDLLKLNGHVDTDHGTWRIQYGLQNNQRKEFDIRRGSLSTIPAIDLQLYTHTLEVEWEQSLGKRLSLCTGLTGMLQNNNNIPGTQRIPFIPNFNNRSAGAYVVTKQSYKDWTLDLGIRYDFRHYDVVGYDYKNTLFRGQLDFHNVSATAGATVKVSSNGSFSTNISSAWRPPHVAELYSLGTHQSAAAIEFGLLLNDSTNEVMNIKDVSFKNEQAVKWVNTYTRQWAMFNLEVSGYANYIFNYIYLRPTGVTETVRGVFPYFRYTQTDALFLGVDLSGTWQLSRSIDIQPKVSLLRASDEKNNDYLIFIPTNRYELTAKYKGPEKFFLKDFYVESKFRYIDKQRRAPRVITVREIQQAQEQDVDPFGGNDKNFDFAVAPPAYFIWNMAAGFSVPSKKARYDFRVAAENILNTSYREYTNRFRYYADDIGRNFSLSIKRIF